MKTRLLLLVLPRQGTSGKRSDRLLRLKKLSRNVSLTVSRLGGLVVNMTGNLEKGMVEGHVMLNAERKKDLETALHELKSPEVAFVGMTEETHEERP